MAGLTFRSILATGSGDLGDARGPAGEGVFDLFFRDIDLPGLVDLPALIVFATKKVDLDKNFVTINAPEQVTAQSFDEAHGEPYFIWRVLPNPTDIWTLQMHQIGPGRLKPSGNVLGIHTRNDEGKQAATRDDFSVARIFLVYHAA